MSNNAFDNILVTFCNPESIAVSVLTCSVVVKVSAIRLVAGDALAKLCILGNDPILSCPLDVNCKNTYTFLLNAILYKQSLSGVQNRFEIGGW